MSSDESPRTGAKRQRIMIFTVDESIIDQMEKSNVSLLEKVVLQSEGSSSGRPDQQSQMKLLHKTNKNKDGRLVCAVCGSSAHGWNFGAIACESCKAFFRRNAIKEPVSFHCNGKGDCPITLETRRNCTACRLAKCFKSGMKCDRILTAQQKAEKHRQIEENRQLALNTTLAESEEEIQLSSSTFSDDLRTPIDVDTLFADFADLLPTHPQQTLLNAEDLQRIETISHSYQNRIELAARGGLPWDPAMHARTFIEVLNSQSVSIMRLLSFFKQIPEFNQLHVDDKITLIKYNLSIILGINCALAYNMETNQIIETDSDVPWNTQFFPVLHGYNISMQLKKIFTSFLHIAKYDRKIIELTLITLFLTKSFSMTNNPNESMGNDTLSVYHTQNYYTELLWKYIETTHGYEKAVDLFSELILQVISWQTIQEEMRKSVLRTLSPEDINELLPIMKSVLRIS